MAPQFKLTAIYERPLAALKDTTVDLSRCATPGEIRFIDCAAAGENILRIYETNLNFPPKDVPYATISYVWRGYPTRKPAMTPRSAFHVKGAESGDPISIQLLTHICAAAVKERVGLIWLDRLCIMQTNKEDKAWQIQQMYSVYQRCAVCFVLPGGINRLAGLGEDTAWIHRAWTLQELLAPPRSLVVFEWTYGSGTYTGATVGRIEDVVPRKSAMADATDILQFCIEGKMTFNRDKSTDATRRFSIPVHIFGAPSSPQAWATMGALRLRGSESGESAVWRSALMRTSSRPVDMILSIMGLFDVSLNPSDFDKDDRVGATVALAKKVLAQRHSATWIGASFHLPESSHLSSFPAFPQSSVSGRAMVKIGGRMKEVSTVVDGDYMSQWWLRHAPKGRIDDEGYLVTRVSAAAAALTDRRGDATPGVANTSIGSEKGVYTVTDLRGRQWRVDKRRSLSSTTKALILYVGKEGRLPSATAYQFGEDTPVRAIAVEAHATGRYHRVASFFLGNCYEQEIKTWQVADVAVGGPKALSIQQLAIINKAEFKVRRKPIEPN
ncbi:hypothetical protein OH77DRAFT_1426681 [Trametes cingulata]|nr:hypothetical protein OH77DRAFT_1426681 [Trametes cingulata]